MSRLPRSQEHLKTAFTAEAASAARFRTYAERAEREELPALAEQWRRLASDKDRLAASLLEAAGQSPDPAGAIREALAEEQYENEVLYPRMIGEVGEATALALQATVSAQSDHIERLTALRRELQAARGDVGR